MLNISCLHSAQYDIAIFEAARRALKLDDVVLRHRVRSDLLAAAERDGAPSPAVLAATSAELLALSKTASGVLLTCSTLGPAGKAAAREAGVPVLRADQALAEAATAGGGTVVVLCAAGSAIASTRALFASAGIAAGAEIEVRLVPGAWERFRAGRHEEYWQLTAAASDEARQEGATQVALAHASMAGAAGMTRERPPLVGPLVGLEAIVAAARTRPRRPSPPPADSPRRPAE